MYPKPDAWQPIKFTNSLHLVIYGKALKQVLVQTQDSSILKLSATNDSSTNVKQWIALGF